jgi:hypothetical protein
MATQTLRDLAREYAKGTLDRESYRRNRSALIDGILAGTIPVEAIDFAPPPAEPHTITDKTGPGRRARRQKTVLDDVDELDVFDITQVVPETSDRTPPRPPLRAEEPAPAKAEPASAASASNYALLVVGAVAIVAIIGLVVAVVFRGNAPPPAAPASGAAAPAAESPLSSAASATAGGEQTPVTDEAAPAVSSAATDAILGFLATRNWSDASMDAFVNEWQSLPQSDRDAASGSGEMAQLANAIYKKLLEARGLSGVIDPATLQQKQDRLIAFARNLGISDSRLASESPAVTP